MKNNKGEGARGRGQQIPGWDLGKKVHSCPRDLMYSRTAFSCFLKSSCSDNSHSKQHHCLPPPVHMCSGSSTDSPTPNSPSPPLACSALFFLDTDLHTPCCPLIFVVFSCWSSMSSRSNVPLLALSTWLSWLHGQVPYWRGEPSSSLASLH
jgi:hypothetical protein